MPGQFEQGQQAVFRKTVTTEDIEAFARITGDTQRLHLDEDFAKRTRFGSRIAHGMLTGGFISACLGTILPGEGEDYYTVYVEQSIKFHAPVMPGDEVTVVVAIEEINGRHLTLCTTCTTDPNDTATVVVATGTSKVCVIEIETK